nr:recombinase RecA [Bdellovibrio sp. HM001]
MSKEQVQQTEREAQKTKALNDALASIEKQFGKNTIMRLDGSVELPKAEAISTGSLALDLAIGIGGLPKGRIVEIYGPESSGKTTIALQTIAQAQKIGGTVAFIDAEHALDVTYAAKLGVNVPAMLFTQPDTGEQALEITEALVRSGAVDVIVVDSVAALVPRAEIEGDMGDSHVGLQARMMSQAMRKLTAAINKSNTMVIFINQIRMKIGVMFGNPETTTGGNALKFYSSVRLEVRRGSPIKSGSGDDAIATGSKTTVKVVKNKMAPPFAKVEVDLMFNRGIVRESEIRDLGVLAGIIEKSGAWYSYKQERMGQGAEQAREYLESNPHIAKEIEDQIVAKKKDMSNTLIQKGQKSDSTEISQEEAQREQSKAEKKGKKGAA